MASTHESVHLECHLHYGKEEVKVLMTDNNISWCKKGRKRVVYFEDIAGAQLSSETICVHAFVRPSAKKNRKAKKIFFTSSSKEEAENFVQTLTCLINNISLDVKSGPQKLRICVLINPFSGTKKARKIFDKYAYPVLRYGHLDLTIVETQFSGHARKFAQEVDINSIDGIVCVSGDGLVWEVLNGLMSRPDWENAIKTPLGIIPAGSGNGLATTLGIIHPTDAALCVVKGFTRPLDVFSVFQNNEGVRQRYYCILSITWAIIADLDIGTEDLRWMGGARFTYGALRNIMKKKKYRAKISFLPATDNPRKADIWDEQRETCDRRTSFVHKNAIEHNEINAIALESHGEIQQKSTTELDGAENNHLILDVESATTSIEKIDISSHSTSAIETRSSGPECVYLHDQSNQAEWQEIDDEFFMFIVSNVAWISDTTKIAPYCHINDGTLDLILVRDCKRLDMLSAMTKIEKGEHMDEKFLEFHKIKALRLEPIGKGSFISADGEKLNYLPFEVEVHQGLARVMCK